MTEIRLRSLEDAEEMTGIPLATWRYWRARGEGPRSVRIGRRVFFREQDIRDWINDQFSGEEAKRVGA